MKLDQINLRIEHAKKNELKAEAFEKHLTLTELLINNRTKPGKDE